MTKFDKIRMVIIMTYKQIFLLYILNQLNGERSIQAIYHLLRGKKSSQTIQDGLFFHISHLFETLPKVNMASLLAIADDLITQDLIVEIEENHYLLTEKGKQCLSSHGNPCPSHLDGYRYAKVSRSFWTRLSLVVQSLSFLMVEKYSFYPITNNQQIMDYVKQYLKGKNKKQLSQQLYHELFDWLNLLPKDCSDMIVLRLTGDHRSGLTNQQIATRFHLDDYQCQLIFEACLHQLIKQIIQRPAQYPCFSSMMDRSKKSVLTESAQVTLNFINKGMDMRTISKVRRLKVSTIEDHLVEIALYDVHFDITPYVPEQLYDKIKKVIDRLKTHRLRVIMDDLSGEVSYLQIRLVLSKERQREDIHARGEIKGSF